MTVHRTVADPVARNRRLLGRSATATANRRRQRQRSRPATATPTATSTATSRTTGTTRAYASWSGHFFGGP